MSDQAVRTLLAWGLQALKSGSEIAKASTAEIQRDAKDPDLKAALQEGVKTSALWAERIERALADVGPTKDVGNPILQAHSDYGRQIRKGAPDDLTRDLGIISAGQLALHYWIASFGELSTYAAALGMDRTEKEMATCRSEAKAFDKAHTALTKKLLGVHDGLSLKSLLPA